MFIRRHAKGADSSVKAHERRGGEMFHLILRRFGVRYHEKWKVKHLRWVLERGLADKAKATRYDYWRTVEVYVAGRGLLDEWKKHLVGTWQRKDGKMPGPNPLGGRPRRLSGEAIRRAAKEEATRSSKPIVWKPDP